MKVLVPFKFMRGYIVVCEVGNFAIAPDHYITLSELVLRSHAYARVLPSIYPRLSNFNRGKRMASYE